MTERYECPPGHSHGEKTTCYHSHGCRCDNCLEGARLRKRARTRAIAYGRHEWLVDSLGARRRIQGLHMLGWRLNDIAEVTGLAQRRISQVQNSPKITARVHGLIVHATGVLVKRGPGPSDQTRKRSRAKGWQSLLAWDDIDHDPDPADKPAYDPTLIDEVRVMHAVDGRPGARLTGAERRAAIRILHARRWTDNRIAHQLGCHERTVYRIRHDELKLPAYEYAELIKQEAA